MSLSSDSIVLDFGLAKKCNVSHSLILVSNKAITVVDRNNYLLFEREILTFLLYFVYSSLNKSVYYMLLLRYRDVFLILV